MGQIPAKGFMPSAPYGSSQGANALNPAQVIGQNPQVPLLPSGFTDPGTIQKPSSAIAPAAPISGGAGSNPPDWMKKWLFGGQ